MIDSRRRWCLWRGALETLAIIVIALNAPRAVADQAHQAERFSFRRLGTADVGLDRRDAVPSRALPPARLLIRA